MLAMSLNADLKSTHPTPITNNRVNLDQTLVLKVQSPSIELFVKLPSPRRGAWEVSCQPFRLLGCRRDVNAVTIPSPRPTGLAHWRPAVSAPASGNNPNFLSLCSTGRTS